MFITGNENLKEEINYLFSSINPEKNFDRAAKEAWKKVVAFTDSKSRLIESITYSNNTFTITYLNSASRQINVSVDNETRTYTCQNRTFKTVGLAAATADAVAIEYFK